MGLGLLALIAQGLGLCPRLDGRRLPSGHPPVPYHWASQASWPVEPADFVAALKEVDMDAVREDLRVMFKTSQAFWPADYGNYAPFFVRLAWHNTGSYRTTDGRGGADGGRQRLGLGLGLGFAGRARLKLGIGSNLILPANLTLQVRARALMGGQHKPGQGANPHPHPHPHPNPHPHPHRNPNQALTLALALTLTRAWARRGGCSSRSSSSTGSASPGATSSCSRATRPST